MALLEIDALEIRIGGRRVVENISLRIEAGETLGLVGESGSGKSMTALAIMQLLPSAARMTGAIRFSGLTLTSMSEGDLVPLRGRDIGMIFQEPMTALNPLMSIGDQVAETILAHARVRRSRARDMAHCALERVGLRTPQIPPDRYPHELSGGQRQRAAIAMAIALAPKLLIADEPTTALDVVTQAGILSLLKQMIREDGSALLMISHDLGVVAHMTDRVAIMHDGRMVEHGPTAELLVSSTHVYTRSLVAASRLSDLRAAARRPVAARLTATPLLDVRDVVCEYRGIRAVDGVSLAVMRGESVGVVGQSGSGKSTLLRSILGVRAIESGQIKLDGESIALARGSRLRRLRRLIQCVFQDPAGSFDPRWRVARLIAEPLHLLDAPLTPGEQRQKIHALLERVGLRAADAERYPHEFSGGQRQRIAIARALVVEPALIAMDEAVSALDVTTRAQILALLADLSGSMGLGVVFVSHDLAVVRSMTERVFVMERGRIVESGATSDVLDSPRHPYTASLVAATLKF
jgi:peptide/nickel transport system ATP-binding protein